VIFFGRKKKGRIFAAAFKKKGSSPFYEKLKKAKQIFFKKSLKNIW